MVISARRLSPTISARAVTVDFPSDYLSVELEDGRRISVPIAWFPKLVSATPEQRSHWRLIGHGIGIHWEELDEDISVVGLLATRDDFLAPSVSPSESIPAKDVVITASGYVRREPSSTSSPPPTP